MGGWQSCSASCGSDGIRKRTVLCVRTGAGEERVLHSGDCRKLPKPKAVLTCNRNVTCGLDWAVGNWSEVKTLTLRFQCINHMVIGSFDHMLMGN